MQTTWPEASRVRDDSPCMPFSIRLPFSSLPDFRVFLLLLDVECIYNIGWPLPQFQRLCMLKILSNSDTGILPKDASFDSFNNFGHRSLCHLNLLLNLSSFELNFYRQIVKEQCFSIRFSCSFSYTLGCFSCAAEFQLLYF